LEKIEVKNSNKKQRILLMDIRQHQRLARNPEKNAMVTRNSLSRSGPN